MGTDDARPVLNGVYWTVRSNEMIMVSTDGHRLAKIKQTLNPGDNPWTELERLGDVQVFEQSRRDQVIQRSEGAEILVDHAGTLVHALGEQLEHRVVALEPGVTVDALDGVAGAGLEVALRARDDEPQERGDAHEDQR